MIETTTNGQKLLISEVFDRVRRNHGLEHATLHVLAEKHPDRPMGGFSNSGGFWVFGDFSTDEVTHAAQEALKRLQSGESKLALHASCGTNYAAAGMLAGAAAGLAMIGVGRKLKDYLNRLPNAMLLATIALIAAQPLGAALQQQVTTKADPEGLRVLDVRPLQQNKLTTHRVITGDQVGF